MTDKHQLIYIIFFVDLSDHFLCASHGDQCFAEGQVLFVLQNLYKYFRRLSGAHIRAGDNQIWFYIHRFQGGSDLIHFVASFFSERTLTVIFIAGCSRVDGVAMADQVNSHSDFSQGKGWSGAERQNMCNWFMSL